MYNPVIFLLLPLKLPLKEEFLDTPIRYTKKPSNVHH